MKNYSFERVHGADDGEQVKLHRNKRRFRFGTKLLCLVLAFLLWLVVTNVRLINEGNQADTGADQSETDQ